MSKQTFKVNFPFKINGVEVKEIPYDPQDFTADDFLKAASRRGQGMTVASPINDTELQFNIGVQALLSSNRDKGWTAEDFKRLRGSDPLNVTLLGMSFFGVSPEAAQEETCEGQSESTQNDFTRAEKTC